MSGLKIIEAPERRKAGWQSSAAMMLRCLAVLAIAVAIRLLAEQRSPSDSTAIEVDLATVQSLVPTAAEVAAPDAGMQEILDANGQSLGHVITTLPAAAEVVGYRGPSNVLLVLDENSSVLTTKLVSSQDTPEHVGAIHRDERFLKQFRGWTQGQPHTFGQVDATSGATLTSLAIAEGIAVRLGSSKPSLRFPDEFEPADLALLFDNPDELRVRIVSAVDADVLNSAGEVVSRLIRTGPLVDSVAGYQGPSELIAAFDPDDVLQKIALRRTWDNQPYAGYLNDEPYFWKAFQQKTLLQLQDFDVDAEQVEGVSGATMTSLAVADTIVAAANAYSEQQAKPDAAPERSWFRWGFSDWGTLFVLCAGITIGLTRLRGRRAVRILWNVILVGYFGLVTGNLISLAVVMGWAAKGIAWRLAPGLAIVILVSLLMPPTTRRNLYCSHLCPHGAAQQLLRNRWKPAWRLSAAWAKRLRWCPGVILIAAAWATIVGNQWNLAAWEPFNAYIWYVAGFSSLALAIGSLVVSAAIPMAYCRYGCATGRLLNYLRRSAASRRFSFADACVLLTAAAAWGLVWSGMTGHS